MKYIKTFDSFLVNENYNRTPMDSKRAWESKRHSIDRSVDYVKTSEEEYHSRKR